MCRNGKRVISILCVLALVVGLVPAALAAEETAVIEEVIEEVPEGVGTMPALAEEETAEVPEVGPDTPEEPDAPAVLLACTCETTPHPKNSLSNSSAPLSVEKGSTHYIAAKSTLGTSNLHFSFSGTDVGSFSDWTFEGVWTTAKTVANGESGFKCRFDSDGMAYVKKGSETILTLVVGTPPHVHAWDMVAGADADGWVTTKTATCGEAGSKERTCAAADCTLTNGKEQVTIPATGDHSFTVSQAARVEPTCYQTGSTALMKCANCDATEGGETIPATGNHSYGADGKCATAGCAAVDPTKCTHATKTTVAHRDATCAADGVVGGEYCALCGDGEAAAKAVIKATGHDFSGGATVCKVCGLAKPADNMAAGGWLEAMYAELDGVSASEVKSVTYSGKMSGKLTGEDKQYLVRDKAKLSSGKSGIRIDIPGIPAGEYTIKVETNAGMIYTSPKVTVKAHDRSGYAHWNYTEGVGAYRDDGILKDNAIVLYVTEENKNTVTLEGPDGTVVTGIGSILNSAGKDLGSGLADKGGKANGNADILKKLADANIPLVVRFIGTVNGGSHGNPANPGSDVIVGLTGYAKKGQTPDYGGTEGDNGFMARMKAGANITLEGIGDDAVIDGWGFHFMANTGDTEAGRGKNFEARNLKFINSPEDSLGMEGVQAQKNPQSALSAPVEHCWVHNCAFYPANITNPAESDKSEGDGACDFKRGQYFTMSYNYFQDCHKTNLVGANKDTVQFHLTFHHNYYVNCMARGPLARNANIHMYNNYYEGQTDTVMSLRSNAYVFSEYNWFERCHRPVAYSDKEGNTGICKSYNDSFISCYEDNSATQVKSKSEKVSSTNRYPSFELDKTLSYIPDEDYALDKSVLVAKANMDAYAGTMKSVLEMVEPEVPETGNLPASRVPAEALDLDYTLTITTADIPAQKEVAKKGINFFVGKSASGVLTLGGKSSKTVGMDNIGYDIIFRVDKNVDITMDAPAGDSTAKTYTAQLYTLEGVSLLEGGGTVKDCPPGIYYIQSNGFDTSTVAKGDLKFKEAKLNGLTITASADQTPPHTTHTWNSGTTTVPATCTKEGTKLYTCSVCGETKRETIPMTDHTMVSGACADCGLLDGVLNADPDAPEVAVTGLTLNVAGQTIGLLQGDSVQGTVTIAPSNATDKSVTWESSNAAVASVSKAGMVTAKAPGTATITVTSNAKADATASFTVKVTGVTTNTYTFSAKSQPATNDQVAATVQKYGTSDYFTLVGTDNMWRTKSKASNVAPMALEVKQNSQSGLTFTVGAGETADVTIAFQSTSSSNSSVLALKAADGSYVTGKSGDKFSVGSGQSGGGSAAYEKLPAGTYTIVVPTTADADAELEDSSTVKRNAQVISVSVTTTKAVEGEYVEVTGVTLTPTTATVEAGSTVALSATVTPNDASNPTVTWSSSDVSVATVAAGTVTGRKAGTATITAKAGSFSATCLVTVTASASGEVTKVTAITVTDEDGRSTSSITADADEVQTIRLTADIDPDDADNKTVTWTSDATAKGVTVDTFGVVSVATTAESCAATITATANDGSGVKGTYTLTVTRAADPIDPIDPDDPDADAKAVAAAVQAAKTALKDFTVKQADVNTEAKAKTAVENKVGTPANAVTKNVVISDFVAAVAGTSASKSGTNGSFKYAVTLSKGDVTDSTVIGTVTITATAYTSGGGNGGGGSMGGGSSSGGGAPAPAEPTTPAADLPFVDVAADDWFADTVKKVYEMGLIKGTDATHFTPTQNTSRAMIATILFRLDGEKATDVQTAFNDVASGAWYSEAVEWAADKGIVKGYSDDVFAPDDNITREQLAVMLFRYADPTILDKMDALRGFVDAESVSDWATDAMQWCVKNGIITGKGADNLDPQGLASRAEAATMIVRFTELGK